MSVAPTEAPAPNVASTVATNEPTRSTSSPTRSATSRRPSASMATEADLS